MESHSRFPPLAPSDVEIAADFNKNALIQTAAASGYAVTYLQDTDLDSNVAPNLRSVGESQPLLFIYRLTHNSPEDADATLSQQSKHP